MIIAGRELEYIEDGHIYLVDGVIVPSITSILGRRFKGMYAQVDKDTLRAAADYGTAVHAEIESYIRHGIETDSDELRGFRFLQSQYGFSPMACEVPVILFDQEEPIAAGRCDLVLKHDGKIGGADIKTTSALQKEYVAYQLNAYRTAYMQSYGIEWEFIWAIQLRGEKRKITPLPINGEATLNLIKEYL